MTMSRADRAKQFMPFAALKGFEESIRMQEQTADEETVLAEDAAAELDARLRAVEVSETVTVKYYSSGKNRVCTGEIGKISRDGFYLVVDGNRIEFSKIKDIEAA